MKRHFSQSDASKDMTRKAAEERQRGRITLAGRPKKPVPPIYSDQKRKALVNEVMDLLRDWRLSPFEHEATCRTGLRVALISKGYAWERSDFESAHIVADGLRLLGAKRPTWDEGQWHHTIPLENCQWCGGPIDAEDMTRGQRFCSVEHAKAAKTKRAYGEAGRHHAVYQSAYILIRRMERPAIKCDVCRTQFHPRTMNATLCSPKCAGIAKTIYSPRPCDVCGKSFHPLKESHLTCSKPCAQKRLVEERSARRPERQCLGCMAIFRPRMEWAVYCSTYCNAVVLKARQKVRKVESGEMKRVKLTPAIVDIILAAGIRHIERLPSRPMLTAEVFDQVWCMAA